MRIKGLEEAEEMIREVKDEHDGQVNEFLYNIASKTLLEAIPLTPSKTGTLRRSLRLKDENDIVKLYSHVNYAYLVHETPKNYTVGGAFFLKKAVDKVYKDMGLKKTSIS